MDKREKLMIFGLIPILIFVFGISLRLFFFCGFVLGDDIEEYSVVSFILSHGTVWSEQLHLRFGVWLVHLVFIKLFGSGEASFFLPTWLMSSSFGVFAYLLLLRWKFSPFQAIWGGLFVLSAPFEVLMGTIHSNDLILSWCIGVSVLLFFYLEKKPVLMNSIVAFLLWFGFYTKLWVVYLFPSLGIYFLYEGLKNKRWAGFMAFVVMTVILHGATSIFWFFKVGEFLPFLSKHAASYPAGELANSLFELFLQYPFMILLGSEMGNSLFGYVPYFWTALLAAKFILVKKSRGNGNFKWDRIDLILFGVYGGFFFFLNFFPNSFKFDQYYSAPRIFRYMTPFSFAATLHVAKLTLEIFQYGSDLSGSRKQLVLAGLFCLILANFYYSSVATGPGRSQRTALLNVVKDIKMEPPPQVIAEYYIGFFIREIYLRDIKRNTAVPYMMHLAGFSQYENWLGENQKTLPQGTLMITGLGSYVYYGGHYDGFRLNHFDKDLDPGWNLVREYNVLEFLPSPEPARLWRWNGENSPERNPNVSSLPRVPVDPSETPRGLFKRGMKSFDSGKCPEAREIFRILLEKYPKDPLAGDARYFSSICSFRRGDWEKTIKEFKVLINENPESVWVAGAHYHIGVSFIRLDEKTEARKHFLVVIEDFSHDKNLVKLAEDQLGSLPRNSEKGLLGDFMEWLRS